MSREEFPTRAAWPAVLAVSAGAFALIGSEILPTSMLTSMARDLDVSPGAAGQAVTVTAIIALCAGLLAPSATSHLDRRMVLLAAGGLLTASNAIVASSSSYPLMLAGRVMLGLAVGTFWAMAAAVTVRLVPQASGARALSIVFSGMAVATVVAAPLGAYIGDIAGWRVVFWFAAGLSAAIVTVQALTLPSLRPRGTTGLGTLTKVISRPGIAVAIGSATAVYIVHVGFQTYVRPLLESTPGATSGTISLGFALLGAGGVIGTAISSVFMNRSLRLTLTLMPVVMGIAGLLLAWGPQTVLMQNLSMFVWGVTYGAVPVAWSVWLTRAVPDQRETASGIFVAAVQVAIALGAGIGGAVFNGLGVSAVYVVGGIGIIASAAAVYRTTGAPLPVPLVAHRKQGVSHAS